MKIFKVKIMVGSDVATCDAIEWQEKLWLVPGWLDDKSQGVSKPARIIRIDSFPMEALPAGSPLGDYILTVPIPIELLEQETPKQPIKGFEYIETPTLSLPPDQKPH